MERVYVPDAQEGETIGLPKDKAHYLTRVHRLKNRDPLLAFDGVACEYAAELVVDKGMPVRLAVGNCVRRESAPRLHLTLAQGLPKQGKLETIIQKATELGVCAIAPFASRFGLPRIPRSGAEVKLQRWRTIAEEACRQCGRIRLPQILAPQPFERLIEQAAGQTVWLADEHKRGTVLTELCKDPAPPELTLIVGPEGGFHEGEVAQAQAAGAQLVSLGPRILRTETAGPALLAIVQTLWGDMGAFDRP